MRFAAFFIVLASGCFFISATLTGQTDPLDSLRSALDTASVPESKLQLAASLAKMYQRTDDSLCFYYADLGVRVANEEGTPEQRYDAYALATRLRARMGKQMDKATTYATEAIHILETQTNDTDRIISAQIMLGAVYDLRNKSDSALVVYEAVLPEAEAFRDTNAMFSIYFNLGRIQRDAGEEQAAEGYYRKAIAMSARQSPVRKGNVYLTLAAMVASRDSALRYFDLAAEQYANPRVHPIYRSALYDDMGKFHFREGDYPEAATFFSKAMEMAEGYPDSLMYILPLFGRAKTRLAAGNVRDALTDARAAHRFLLTYPDLDQQIESYELLAELEAASGRGGAAYVLQLTARELRDSLNRERMTEALAENNVRFATAEKEAQIITQELQLANGRIARNRLTFGGLGLLVLLAGIFQYFLQRNRLRSKELALEVEKRETEANQLRELDGLKTRFFTNISHELRTPLTLITSPLEEAIGRLKQINLKPDLELAHRNSQNLLTLVNEILDLSKLEAGQLSTEKATFSPDPLLRRFFHAFDSLADQQKVSMVYGSTFPDDVQLTTDVRKLEKIVNNLLSNALKYSPGGGTITLNGTVEGEALRITVADEGPGIRPADQERIFDRYFQATDRTLDQGGTGIGLNLSRKLARLLGGDLVLAASSERGSTFLLTLPVGLSTGLGPEERDPGPDFASSTSIAPATPHENTVWQPSGERARILLVEDNAEMADYLERHLSPFYEVTKVANGLAALAALSKRDFDLISSDVMMPEMDGFELRERINEHEKWRTIPFLLLTARNLEEDVLRGFRLGVDDYVTKPFSLPEYQARVNSLLENREVRAAVLRDTPEAIASPEDDLVARAEALIRSRLNDTTFSVEEMARELGHGQRQLSRLLGAATGLTPVKFILELRLQKARQLLESKQYATVAEVRYEIGIESASYFTRKYTERFGKNPSEN